MLELRTVVKRFGSAVAVRDVSLRVEQGEVFGLLGPNGAGKTTTLRMIVGLSEPSSGTVELTGLGSPRCSRVRRSIGYAPQSLCVYDELSARENLALIAGLYGLRGKLLRERVASALAFVSLESRADDRVCRFSVGMKRRLTLATAIVHEPRLLVLDEPTAGVDPQSRNAIFENLLALKARGVTIIYTTHFMEEAESLCDRVAIIDRGEVLAIGGIEELLASGAVGASGGRDERPVTGSARGLEQLFLELTGHELRDT